MVKRRSLFAIVSALILLGGLFLFAKPSYASSASGQGTDPVIGLPPPGTHLSLLNLAQDNVAASANGPNIPHPAGSIVEVPIYNVFVSHNTTSNAENTSVVFPTGHFSRITVTFYDVYISNPFDTSFIVSVNGVQILAGNTLELENTSVTQDVTEYSSIFAGTSTVFTTCPQFNPGYSSTLSVWFTFYNGTTPSEPNKVLPAFTSVNFPTPKNAFPNNVPIPFNVSRTTTVTFPNNVTSAYLNLYEQQNGNDEFWYTLQPPFREFRVFIDQILVATVQPYPNIQTGGGDLFLWQPILAIGAEVYPPTQINLNPYLSLLNGQKNITIEVVDDENLWIRSAANFMLTTSASNASFAFISNAFQFSNSYNQMPSTNFTTESIPTSAAFLNDTQYVNETLTASGNQVNGTLVTDLNNSQTVSFFANSTEYDPSFNILQNTPYGLAVVFVQNFFMKEKIQKSYSQTLMNLNKGNGALSSIQTDINEYYQVYGTQVVYLVLNQTFSLTSIVIGFNVTQVKAVAISTTGFISTSSGDKQFSSFNSTYEKVVGNGKFDAAINSESEITALYSNHATTTERLLDTNSASGEQSTYFFVNEKAVNDSLVNRNGTFVYQIVRQRD